jgi:hypothetical protein
VEKEPGGDGHADLVEVGAGADHVQFVAVHDGQQLLAHVLRAPHGARLDEVLEAPGVAELGGLPGLVHRQQRQVVTLCLEELGLLLVCLRGARDRVRGARRPNAT